MDNEIPVENEIRVGRAPARHVDDGEALLVVDDLKTHFDVAAGSVRAVDGVSFSLSRGRTLGVVGESGSGKTVLSRSIMGLNTTSNAHTTGSVMYAGQELIGKSAKQKKALWGAEMAMVFQDPMTSLNPVVTIGRQLTEHVRYHLDMSKKESRRGRRRAAQVGAHSRRPRSVSMCTRTRCPAACVSASASPSPSPVVLECSSPTSRPRRST